MKTQFYLEHVEFNAQQNLKCLQHTGTVREYVKQFSQLMLDFRDMSDKDKLWWFFDGSNMGPKLSLTVELCVTLQQLWSKLNG